MKLISEEYRELISELHSIGKWGGESTKPRILATIRDHIGWQQATTLIDYGSGNIEGEERSLKWALKDECNVIEYEPAIKSKSKSPDPQDYVVSVDVLEHVEPEYIDNVLDDLKRIISRRAFFTISCAKALLHLPDGRNAHLIVKPREWWMAKIEERFTILEEHYIYRNKHQLRLYVQNKGRK